jgi:hypothetical protein
VTSLDEFESSLHALSKLSPLADLFLCQRELTSPVFDSCKKATSHTSIHSIQFSISLISPILHSVTLISPIFHSVTTHTLSHLLFLLLFSLAFTQLVHFAHHSHHSFIPSFLSFLTAVPTSFAREPSLHPTHLFFVLSRSTRACTLLSRALISISLSITAYPEHTHTQTHSYLASCFPSSILSLPRSFSLPSTVPLCGSNLACMVFRD